jgi:hypothetical protein
MALQERYATAVHARNLAVDSRTTMSNTDVLAGMALASLDYPLGVALERLFAGDNRAAKEIVRILAEMVFAKSKRLRVKIGRTVAHDLACACLAWHRNGRCPDCGGHGKTLIPGTGKDGVGGFLSEHDCQTCRGTGSILFENQFRQEHQELARWLVVEMTREAGRAGPAAMAKIAPKLDL